MKTYIVTGASGYLGSMVVKKLIDKGRKVRALVLKEDKNIDVIRSLGAKIYYGDILDIDSLSSIFKGENLYLIHSAGMITIERKYDKRVYDINIEGTKNIIKKAEESNIKRLLYVSSVHVFKDNNKGYSKTEDDNYLKLNDDGHYAITKSKATKIVSDYIDKNSGVIVHPSGLIGKSVVGKGQITPFIELFIKGKLPYLIHGGHDFVNVSDVSDFIVKAVDSSPSKSYILSGEYNTMEDILRYVSKLKNIKPPRRTINTNLLKYSGRVIERVSNILKVKPILTEYMVHALNTFSFYSNLRAKKELGFKPRSTEETIKELIF